MDALTTSSPTPNPSSYNQDEAVRPAMPAEALLPMPVQYLDRFEASQRRDWANPASRSVPWLARLVVFGGGLALTLYGAFEMYKVIDVGPITTLKWALLVLFLANFSWISIAFASSLVGFFWLLAHRAKSTDLPERLTTRTAIVMPIYNEAPSRVVGSMEAMIKAVSQTGLAEHFDWFFLSDTTNPNIWIGEESAFLSLRQKMGDQIALYYRHRPRNINRKAGNIADFVSRWGGHYDHMLVLDADSVMSGEAIIRIVAAMEADPDAGIIQSVPLIVNRNTLFARVQQFAARIYGPILATGMAIWSGRDCNYWGHNAIIRTRAFAAHCGLPDLRGRPPFGGHVLSHDFVEAALIRRAGYGVRMLPLLTGSYEESPPSLIDLAARDRRWCQGNLQHIRILPTKGLKLATRQHLATGIMGYLASPLWMAQLLIGIALVLQSTYIRPEYFTNEFALFPAWPRFDAERALSLFGVTMSVLLAPKLFGLLVAMVDQSTRQSCGGALRLILSTLLEVILSALVAPIMMVIQTGSVMQILFGSDTGWSPQRRDDGSIPFIQIVRRHRSHVILGIVTLIAALLISPSLAAWMSPTIAGLILAIGLSWASGQLWIGLALRRMGLLLTPEESQPPEVMQKANALQNEMAMEGHDGLDCLRKLHSDAAFREAHVSFLPVAGRRHRGEIDTDHAVAQTKLMDAQSVEDAQAWLKPRERFMVLHDRALIEALARLPHENPLPQSVAAAG